MIKEVRLTKKMATSRQIIINIKAPQKLQGLSLTNKDPSKVY